jgi:hypothetical protein
MYFKRTFHTISIPLLLLSVLFFFKGCNTPIQAQPSSILSNIGLVSDTLAFKPPANAVHIDPESTADSLANGSRERPFNSFDDMVWKDGMVVLVKRNTVLRGKQITISANNVTIASYGTGKRPVIFCVEESVPGANRHAIVCDAGGIDNLTLRDLEITAPRATSCIRLLRNCNLIQIINCLVHDSYWGIRSLGNKNVLIHNTEVYNTRDDGIFFQDTYNIEIQHCYIHHVNLNWKPPTTPEKDAAGDGIQLDRCNNWHVHHNLVDRVGSGNKFCFISNNPGQDKGVLEYNIFKGPSHSGSVIYLGDGSNIIVRYNLMANCAGSPLYTHGKGFMFYGNIMADVKGPLFASNPIEVFNNLFYRPGLVIMKGNTIHATNNIYYNENRKYHFEVKHLSGSNNLYFGDQAPKGSFKGKPLFKDPENLNFQLLPGSDGVDMGKQLIPYKQDILGTQVPQGDGPDIGPFEYR